MINKKKVLLLDAGVDLSEKDKFDATLNKYLITKGNNLTITFETDNINGLKRAYQEGFFNVTWKSLFFSNPLTSISTSNTSILSTAS